jgi:hypothetical protein
MKSEQQVRKRLAEIQHDARMGYKPATVFENAPLALIQTEGEAVVGALLWVLGERESCAGSYPERAEPGA